MPDSEDNIYYKISRMIKDEFDAFRKEIKQEIRDATNDYKKLWEKTEDQEGRIKRLEEFKDDYKTYTKPKIDNMSGQVKVLWVVGTGAFAIASIIAGKLILG